ncbi:MAG TPA: lipoyl(octanoyl) transferase LipB [Mycobacteriales bacterium]|nr:lipoyl(octanoyl) transferase LipB [Mycobacteriales bacterium]
MNRAPDLARAAEAEQADEAVAGHGEGLVHAGHLNSDRACGVARRPQDAGFGLRAYRDRVQMIRAGVVEYDAAWAWQRELHAARVEGSIEDTCLLLEHPSVYTAGRRTEDWERPTDGTPVIDADRGGKITWHGPGQLTGYPIVALPDPLDVVGHVRRLESALISVCSSLGLPVMRVEGRSGVWLPASPSTGRPERKVAAIGVRVARGVTMHGFALNCNCDLSAYDRIVPCGIRDAGVTSLSAELGRDVTVAYVVPFVEAALESEWAMTVAIGTAMGHSL